jgi:hypothetical protein
MACPYFVPLRRDISRSGALPIPLPLGDAWTGICKAAESLPEPAILDSLCWFGYARGRCRHFPEQDAGPDAVRFVVRRDNGVSLDLYYVLERDHHPFAHGRLGYSVEGRRLIGTTGSEAFESQAEAYVDSYLRRRRS